MNTQKINFQERYHQQKHGLVSGDCGIQFGNHSSDYFGVHNQHHQQQQQPPWNMRIQMQSPAMETAGSSNTILSRFESPASAFYATEIFMGFPHQYDCQFSRACASEFPPYQFSRENFPVVSAEQIPKSDLCNNQYYRSPENSYRNPGSSNNLLGSNKPFPSEQNKLVASDSCHFSGLLEENQDHRVYGSPIVSKMNYTNCQQPPRFSLGGVSSGNSSVSSGAAAVLSSKTRIRWTQDLHEKFVGCVNRLGGADKATPKAILKLMDSDGLTIFHVKSHLQKYRMAKYIPDSSEGKSETKNSSLNDLPQLDVKTGLQIKEALQLQLDVQMRLHEQLEIQRNLQLRIEEQGRQLKMLFDQQQRSNSSSQLRAQSSESTTPHDDELTFSLVDIEDSTAQDAGNTHLFLSKIS